jgi:hypothetical protein
MDSSYTLLTAGSVVKALQAHHRWLRQRICHAQGKWQEME